MSEWHSVSEENEPDPKAHLEIVGYHTTCCEKDADAFVTIRRGFYTEPDGVFETDDGYFILPLYWRVVQKVVDEDKIIVLGDGQGVD